MAVALGVFVAALIVDSFARPISTLMLGRLATGQSYQRDYVRLDQIAPVLVATVIASEDAGFCRNRGVDWDALHEVIGEGGEGGASRGASTITMQTAKNLFLWPSRSVIRKGAEIGIALVLGQVWSKAHTIEVYLNIAEWGDGIFGAEAAARHWFGCAAADLRPAQAARLAVALPNPLKRSPAVKSRTLARRAERLVRAMARAGLIDAAALAEAQRELGLAPPPTVAAPATGTTPASTTTPVPLPSLPRLPPEESVSDDALGSDEH